MTLQISAHSKQSKGSKIDISEFYSVISFDTNYCFKEKCPFLFPRSEVRIYEMQICNYTQTYTINRTFKV